MIFHKILTVILKILVVLIGLGFVFSAVGLCAAINLNAPPDIEKRDSLFEVKQGESASIIGLRLEDAGFIKSRWFWYILNRWKEEPLKAGSYRLELPATQIEIYNVLTRGKQMLVKVTIPEGLTVTKTARVFAEAAVCEEEEFLQAVENTDLLAHYFVPASSFEGYLFPDTYFFEEHYPAERVVQVLVDNFFKHFKEIADDKLSPREIFEKVTLASIVEREYRLEEEAPVMASVFFNRMKINMALQSCATVEYIITEIQGKPHPEVLLTQDTKIRDPYNTYIYKGLPPAPIANPGYVALNAVLNPAPSDYLYFRLIDPSSGKHYFSKTFDSHIEAGKLYVKR
ncbi:MAG: endolytic transglycosylase MltG [Treponema sp.]|jgi:UPF0755 protein|nr:endolytic transglycosylase MltG [Treponema sp.]